MAGSDGGDQTAMARERTAEARRRTHLANERTYAAWIRTALALVALGRQAAPRWAWVGVRYSGARTVRGVRPDPDRRTRE